MHASRTGLSLGALEPFKVAIRDVRFRDSTGRRNRGIWRTHGVSKGLKVVYKNCQWYSGSAVRLLPIACSRCDKKRRVAFERKSLPGTDRTDQPLPRSAPAVPPSRNRIPRFVDGRGPRSSPKAKVLVVQACREAVGRSVDSFVSPEWLTPTLLVRL